MIRLSVLVLLFVILTACNSNVSAREHYDDAQLALKHGVEPIKGVKLHRKGSYIYAQPKASSLKYGIDYKRSAFIIQFKTRF